MHDVVAAVRGAVPRDLQLALGPAEARQHGVEGAGRLPRAHADRRLVGEPGVEGARELTGELIDTSMAAIAPLGKGAVHLRELARIVRDR